MKTKTWLLVVVLAMMAGDRYLAAMSYIPSGGGGLSTVTTDGTTVTGDGSSASPIALKTPVPSAALPATGIGGAQTNNPGSDSVVNPKNYGAKGDVKIAYDGTMTAGTYYSSNVNVPFVLDFRGVNTTTPIDPGASGTTKAAGNTSAPSAPATTSTVANDYQVTAYGWYQTSATLTGVPAGPTSLGALAGTTYAGWAGYLALGAPGAQSAVSGTLSGSANWVAVSLLLQPAIGQTITFIGSSANIAAGNLGMIVDPPGTKVGDVEVICATNNVAGGWTPAAGWVLAVSQLNAGGNNTTLCYTNVVTTSSSDLHSVSGGFLPTDCQSGAGCTGATDKLVCVAGAAKNGGSSFTATGLGPENCGTIVSYISANDVITTAPNIGYKASTAGFTIGATAKTITGASEAGSLATFTCGAGGFQVAAGQQFTVAGVTPAGYNGTWTAAYSTGLAGTTIKAYLTNTGLANGTIFGTATPLGIYAYGTDDSAAFAAAFTALAANKGGKLFIPQGLYGIGSSLYAPTNVDVLMEGSGSGLPYWLAEMQPNYGGQVGTGLMFLTLSLAAPGLNFGASTTNNGFGGPPNSDQLLMQHFHIKDMSLVAGVGLSHLGGGGSTARDGLYSNDISHLVVDNVDIENFSGNCLEQAANVPAPPSGGNVYTAIAVIKNGHYTDCGLQGLVLAGQNVTAMANEVDGNYKNGINATGGASYGGLTILNNILQWNNQSGTNPGYDLFPSNPLYGCTIQNNWFEDALSGSNTTPFPNSANFAGCELRQNYFNNGSVTQVLYSGAGTAVPTCAAAAPSLEHGVPICVTDAAACTNATEYAAGGGAINCLVQCDPTLGAGTHWIETGAGCY